MLKKQWNTSKHSSQEPVASSPEKINIRRRPSCFMSWRPATGCRLLFFVFWLLATSSWLLCFSSCAPKYVEKPSREGVPLPEILSKMNTVQSVEAVLSIAYEKNNASMSGDAFLSLSPDTLELRIYYFGILAGQVTEDHGVIKSKPKLDKYKSIILVDGLRNSFLWWTIRDYTVEEKEDSYVLRNFDRTLTISKKTLLPLEQTIELDNGEEMTIAYDDPACSKPGTENNGLDPETGCYQSRLLIRYRDHQVKVRVKSYEAR